VILEVIRIRNNSICNKDECTETMTTEVTGSRGTTTFDSLSAAEPS